MRRLKLFSLAILLIVLVAAPLVVGATTKKANENIYIGPTEVLNQNVYKAGNVILIEGQINGDLFVAGNMVTIKGDVAGSIFAAGSNIDISGNVSGSVFAAGSSVSVSGLVGKSVRIAGSNITLASTVAENAQLFGANITVQDKASIGWDLTSGGASVNIAGDVGRHAELFIASATISSDIGGNVNAKIEEEGGLALLPGSKVNGDLKYSGHSKELLDVSDGAMILGETEFELVRFIKKDKLHAMKMFAPLFVMFNLVMMIGIIIIGMLIAWMAPKPTRQIADMMMKNPLPNIGWGAVYLFLTPIAIIILMATVVGIPLAGLLVLMYIISLMIAKIFAALLIGMGVVGALTKAKKPSLIWSLISGVILLTIASAIPLIGWLFKLVMILWALGALIMYKKAVLEKLNK